MKDPRFFLKQKYTKSRALVIGIDQYEKASPLGYAVSDAAEFRLTLVDTLGFDTNEITYLTNAEATKQKILAAYARFALDDIDFDDRIIIFFAGHGHTRSGLRGEAGYLVPYDADPSDISTLIRWNELTGNADLIRAKHVLFIMDACYGGLALTRALDAGSVRFINDMHLRFARQVLTAGKADEVVADEGGPLPGHSVFTGHLLEGIRGKAHSAQGILTANGLMAYVYNNVARDKNSRQTPHYGYFDGDGDLILLAPIVSATDPQLDDSDRLLPVPLSAAEATVEPTLEDKAKYVKEMLASEDAGISLHDSLVGSVRRFLAATSDDNFRVQGSYAQEELLNRISQYEIISRELCVLLSCVAYWVTPARLGILQKVMARAVDRLDVAGGLVIWINLRWYPIVRMFYSAGIAAVEAGRYDSIAAMIYASVPSPGYRDKNEYFVESLAEAMRNFARDDTFKRVPGHERQYTPLSEYLFKSLQPDLEDTLFMGKGYERSFDEFEVLFALLVSDLRKQANGHFWGPIGRFGWKHGSDTRSPFLRVVENAKSEGNNWAPLKAGLFGGSLERFIATADEFSAIVAQLHWW